MEYIINYSKFKRITEQSAPTQSNQLGTISFNLGCQWPVGKTEVSDITPDSLKKATAVLSEIKDWVVRYIPIGIVITIDAYESNVTPTDPNKRDLWYAKNRRESAKRLIGDWLRGLNLPEELLSAAKYVDGKTERRGDAYVANKDNPNDPKYVDDQAIDVNIKISNEFLDLVRKSVACGGDASVEKGKAASKEITGPAGDQWINSSDGRKWSELGNAWLYQDERSGTEEILSKKAGKPALNYTRALQVSDPGNQLRLKGKLKIQFDPVRIPDRLTGYYFTYQGNEIVLRRLFDTGFRGTSEYAVQLSKTYNPKKVAGEKAIDSKNIINGKPGNYEFTLDVPSIPIGGLIFVNAYAPLGETIFNLKTVCE